MRKLIIMLFCLLSLSTDMQAAKVLQNVYARKTTSLNGEWQTIIDPFDAGYTRNHSRKATMWNTTSLRRKR